MNGFGELRLQVANDRIQQLHAEAARRRLITSREADTPSTAASRWSIGSTVGRSLRLLGLAH